MIWNNYLMLNKIRLLNKKKGKKKKEKKKKKKKSVFGEKLLLKTLLQTYYKLLSSPCNKGRGLSPTYVIKAALLST
jgi:ribosomal protein S4